MPASFKEGMQNCVRYATHANAQLPKPEECPSDSSSPDSMEQDYYYQDDPHCPCYMCANGIDSKSNYSDDEASTGVEFAVRNFWRLAKSQNDVESPMEGQCRGFHYKLLLHPRGTAGTDSESSHLSVFVEAVVQDWYPEYWVFPNVRFELTVVNFKDPKQSVTSWAHWSFSSDATSRGWQKMISHSSLTKTAGFLDDEGTVLVRGKAEPPYPLLWSKDPLYHPPMMWEYIPNRAQREVACELPGDKHYMCTGGGAGKYNRKFMENFSCHASCTVNKHSPLCKFALFPQGDPPGSIASGNSSEECATSSFQATGGAYSPSSFEKVTSYDTTMNGTDVKSLSKPIDALSINLQEQQQQHASRACKSNTCGGNMALLKILDSLIPCIQPTLDADLVAIMTHILYHIREFRKQIFMWSPPPPTPTPTQQNGNTQQQTNDRELKQDEDSNIIVALQKTFAYMQLYPLAVAYKIYKSSGGVDSNVSKYFMYELWPKLPVTRRGYGNHHIHYKSNVNCDGEQAQLNCCVYGGGTFEWELVDVERNKSNNKTAAAKLFSSPDCKQATASQNASNDDHAMDTNITKYTMAPGTLSYSIGQRPDVFEKLLPQPPNLKILLKAMHMTDLQVLDIHDQLVNIHSELFTMLLRDLAIAKRNLKRSRIFSGSVRPEDVPFYLRDQTELEATCKSLFSGCNESEGLFHNATVGDISSIYIRCKHSHSLQRAIKATAKNLAKYPDVLFFYLYPAKNAKRGELFDVPLRLDCTHLSDPFAKRAANSQDSSTLNQTSSNSQEFKRNIAGSNLGADGEANTTNTTSEANIPPSRFTFAYSEDGDVDDDEDDTEDDEDDTEDGDDETDADEIKRATAVDGGGKAEGDEDDDDDTDEGDVSDATRTYPTSASGMKADAIPIKWYSLYALVIKEGDVRGESLSNNSNGFYWLLLRPEEDGPWFRICEGRVERLVTKMEFTEWKCHRDFFCAAAVYIAEDYIDMLQVGEIDLTGCLKTWNPDLFKETLQHLGVTAEEILNPTFLRQHHMHARASSSFNNPFFQNLPIVASTGGATNETAAKADVAVDHASRRDVAKLAVPVPEASSGLGENLANFALEKQRQGQGPGFCSSWQLGGGDNDNYNDDDSGAAHQPSKTMDHFVNTGNTLLDGIIYSRKIGQRHPRLYSSCEVHGYSKRLLEAIDAREFSGKMIKFASDREVYRRIHRAEIILPFIDWLFTASKENTALLNSIKVLDDAKLLIKFLQQRERLFEEEFRHLICEVFFQEMGEHMATNSIYRWPNVKGCGDCNCKKCSSGCPSLLLTENGRYPCEELRSLLVEPATILFRNIQILRCHLEYFCKDCRNLSFQSKTEQRRAEIAEFKATSERSALFLIECIWDACVRYTQDCRTIIYLKSTSDPNTVINSVSVPLSSGNSATCALEQMCQFGTQKKTPSAISPGTAFNVGADNPKDLFVFDGSLSQNTDVLDGDVADYYETKYDLSIEDEHKVMSYYRHKYDIPTATEMRKYLRNRQMLVHGLIRPHELATCYLGHKYPGHDFRKELADLGISISWNERAFDKRASLVALSHRERKQYGISSTVVDVDIINIGNALCDIYQNLISKMLLHMQDADKSLDNIYYDYVYTCSDIGKVVDAIQSECAKTLNLEIPQLEYLGNINDNDDELREDDDEVLFDRDAAAVAAAMGDVAGDYHVDDANKDTALAIKKQRKDVCSCESMYTNCRIPARPHIPCIPDFTITIAPGGNKDVDGSSCSCASSTTTSAIPPETPVPLEDDVETKPKRKAKVRKQNVEKGACIVPPLDYKLAHMVINQQMACARFERLFPKITDLMKHSHLNSHVEHLGKLNPGGESERVCIIGQSRTGGHDFNLAMNFAKMLKVKNAGDKSLPNPLLLMRDQDDQRAKRIKTAIEVGLITSHDLCGCEGFASEERIKPSKRLMVFTEVVWDGKVIPTRVEHLYWSLRKFMHNQIPVDFDNRYMPPSKTKKPKGVSVKCVCGGSCNVSGGDEENENECRKNLKWRPVPRDAFILYALRAESNNPIRKGRRRFMFMHPESELLNYVTMTKNSDATRNPNVTILMVGAPSTLYNSPTPFPLADDSEYPLLLFKWMCIESVDLLTIGAVVCDSKKQLQQYIFEWLLPTVREMGYLERLGSSEKEDIDNYQVLEECSVRTVQNVRRWSCAIRKINKRTGDIIITQLKRTVDSPPSLRFKEAVAFMHTVRDLAELEALELLPPSAATATGENFNAPSSQPLTSLLSIQETEQDTEGNEKPAEDSQKLKKKKKKTPKTAIPANKRSNFSRSLHDNESRVDDEDYDELGSYEQATPEHQTTPQPEQQHQLKSIDLYNMLEEALEALMVYDATIAISKLTAGVAKTPNSGLIAPLVKGHVQEEFLQDAIAYICDVLIDDLDAFDQLVPVDTSVCKQPSIRTTTTPRSRAAIDLLVAFADYAHYETVVTRVFEKDTFKAAGLGFYLLCALGTRGLEKWRRKNQSSLVAIIQTIANACIEHASWFFIDRESRLYNDVLQSILFGLEAMQPLELDLGNNPNLLYLLGICKDRTKRSLDGSGSSAEEQDEEEEGYIPFFSPHGFRRLALEAFTGGKPQAIDTDKRINQAFASVDSPFKHYEHLEELDKVTLQALGIWWRKRELALANLRSSIIAAGGIDLDVSTLRLNFHAYCRLLEECCHRFGDEIFLANGNVNGNGLDAIYTNGKGRKELDCALSVALVANQENSIYSNGNDQANGFKRQRVDYNSLDAMLAPLTSLDPKSSQRGIPNVPLCPHHETITAASVYEMRLRSQTVALVVMSLAKDGKVTRTKTINDIIQRYYSLTGHHIPAAPSFAPPNTVATN